MEIEMNENSDHHDPIGKTIGTNESTNFANRIDYTFKSINHYVNVVEKREGKNVKTTKQILHDINGTVKAGEMLAIMGPSGAGKTTLLDILAHRLVINGTGKLMMNSTATPYKVFKKLSGYVTQSDTLTAAMTVRETLSFYAQLKMSRDISYEDKMKKVESVISEMGLKRCANTLVGNDKIRGISGGERRRVTIAIELLTGPSVLFLDEPTSGLDASTSYSVIKAIRKLANSGRTVICTIHQPRLNIYELFDKLLLLGEGATIYNGDARTAVNYFNELGYECNAKTNPADFFMDLINTQIEDDDEDDTISNMESNSQRAKKLTPEEIIRLKKVYSESADCQHLKQSIEELERHPQKEITYTKTKKATMFEQYKLLMVRELLNLKRNPMSQRIQIMSSIFQGLLCGLVYYQLGNGQTSIQSRTGVLAFVIMGIGFPSVMLTVQVFPEIISIFLKDRASGVYSTLPFFLVEINTRLSGCGFFINLNDVPRGWIFMPYLSFFKYVIEAAVVNAFTGIEFSCHDNERIGGRCPTQTGFRCLAYGVLSFKSRPIKFKTKKAQINN
ncbi:ABC transporter G family protein [Heterostelium album PN500]|uniref:ABC transporter G family protein n=1 Tax=Heterostelium pallidum (strain ATCC 26659 / Pp 5 / PN500) TaxID=670386 RepID=D3BLC1_HETP5|nr:ABC transporter G family protein [Heterostelium album PN500]EFA77855.1 ABC transporter G family protein [Heterostelium album PN500]|eukprot:XP_020429983.1 ABC transporter G family protein [Heterostelium album PN500]